MEIKHIFFKYITHTLKAILLSIYYIIYNKTYININLKNDLIWKLNILLKYYKIYYKNKKYVKENILRITGIIKTYFTYFLKKFI